MKETKNQFIKYLPYVIFIITAVVYLVFAKKTFQNFNYFVPLADSLIKGKIDVARNAYLSELIQYKGMYFVVFPPLPAILLAPFVFLIGLKFNQVYASIFFGSVANLLFFLTAQKLFKNKMAILLALTFSFGTGYFYLSIIGSGWYFAQVTGIMFLIGSVLCAISKRPALSGILLGLAVLCRLPLIFAFPVIFYLLSRDKSNKRTLMQFLKFSIPVVIAVFAYGLYNYLRFGSFFETGYSLIPGVLDLPGYKYGIMNLKYIWRNLSDYLFKLPQIGNHFPYLFPTEMGLAIWLTTPALLLLFWLRKTDKLAIILLLGALPIAIIELMHGESGWYQFGMRFSLDFIIFLLLAAGFVIERIKPKYAYFIVSLCILINLWGVILWHLGMSSPK